MAAIGLLVAIPVTIILSGETEAPPPEPLAEIEVPEPQLGPKRVDDALGVRMQMPAGWERNERQGVLELESQSGAARIAISAPGPAGDADQLHSEVVAGLRSSYREFEVVRNLDKAPLGGLEGQATVAMGTAAARDGGRAQRILVSTAKGDERAYVAVVFTAAEQSAEVLEAQALVNSLRFTK